jgi:hypothetical protein
MLNKWVDFSKSEGGLEDENMKIGIFFKESS